MGAYCAVSRTVRPVTPNELLVSLAPYQGIAGLPAALTRLLAGVPLEANPQDLLAGHLVATDTYIGVYLLARSHFALLEATRDGQMLSLVVPAERIRRIATLEDATGTKLTIELDADKADVNGELAADGTITVSARPAGYELLAMTDPERASLRQFSAAYVLLLAGR
jgi:hypothetical protein